MDPFDRSERVGHLVGLDRDPGEPPSDPALVGPWLEQEHWRGLVGSAVVMRAGAMHAREEWGSHAPSSDRRKVVRLGQLAEYPGNWEALIDELTEDLVRTARFGAIADRLAEELDRTELITYSRALELVADLLPGGTERVEPAARSPEGSPAHCQQDRESRHSERRIAGAGP